MTSEQDLEEVRSLMGNLLYSTDHPSKHELIIGIVFVLKEKLAKLSYEDVQQFAKDIKVLEDTDD